MYARTILGAVVSALLFMTILAPAGSAQNTGVVSEADNPAGFLYWEDGLLAMTGSAPQFCASPVPPTLPGQVANPANGSSLVFTRGVVEATVYEIPDFPVDRIDLVAGWLLSNCDADPVATGNASLRSRFRFDTNGAVHVRNSLNGTLTSPDGATVRLHAFARGDFDAATGAPIEIHRLDVALN